MTISVNETGQSEEFLVISSTKQMWMQNTDRKHTP